MGELISGTAKLSADGKYRYSLVRDWGPEPRMAWCMLNPSTADAERDDSTIRRCIGFAKRERFGGIYVVNLMAFRARNPTDAMVVPDPCGPYNNDYLEGVARRYDTIVCAWGSGVPRWLVQNAFWYFMRGNGYKSPQLLCLGKNKDGSPRHPLFVPKSQPLIVWKRT